jgi:hypothetical protein
MMARILYAAFIAGGVMRCRGVMRWTTGLAHNERPRVTRSPSRDRVVVPIRLAIVGLPKLLADIIAAAFTDDDAVLIDRLSDDKSVDRTARDQRRYDVIVVGVTDPWESAVLNHFSTAKPTLLGVRTDCRESWIYRMQPYPHSLELGSPAEIVPRC